MSIVLFCLMDDDYGGGGSGSHSGRKTITIAAYFVLYKTFAHASPAFLSGLFSYRHLTYVCGETVGSVGTFLGRTRNK